MMPKYSFMNPEASLEREVLQNPGDISLITTELSDPLRLISDTNSRKANSWSNLETGYLWQVRIKCLQLGAELNKPLKHAFLISRVI